VEKEKQFFLMCPPFEITGRKKRLVVAQRGHFEISQNLVQYKLANDITNFLTLNPGEGTGSFSKLPPESNFDSYQLLRRICQGIIEISFFSPNITDKARASALDFIYGDKLPFSDNSLGPGFYNLHSLHPNVFEEFYRLAEQQEDAITTAVGTFVENVFIPFKQKVIRSYHTDGEEDEEKAKVALETVNVDFPKFLNLHQDLQTILYNQARLVTDYQSVSFSIISPLLRKFRMLNLLKEALLTETKKKGIEVKFRPRAYTTDEIANLITPVVIPR
jgi:hypothetical protein